MDSDKGFSLVWEMTAAQGLDSLIYLLKDPMAETSLTVQWLGIQASNAGDMGLIPSQGAKILHAKGWGQKIKNKKILRKQPGLAE